MLIGPPVAKYRWTFLFALLLSCLIGTAAYAVTPPVITPSTGVYLTPLPQVMITAQPGASIYYTLNGTTPTLSSTLYTGAFTVGNPATIKAIAYISPNQSTVTSSYIQYDPNSLGVTRTGLQLWLKSDFGVLTAGTAVNGWVDLSGSGNNATQSGIHVPTFVANAINGACS